MGRWISSVTRHDHIRSGGIRDLYKVVPIVDKLRDHLR